MLSENLEVDHIAINVKENMDNFGEEYLNEANVDVLQKIVKDKQNTRAQSFR